MKDFFQTALRVPLATLLCAVLLETDTFASMIDKANNVDNLNLGSSWVGGALPGSNDIAQWSAFVTGVNTVGLGANLNWAGIKIASPGGMVTLSAGNILDLGASGLDLSAASQNLTFNCLLNLSTNQSWNIGSGRTVAINSNISGTAMLTLSGAGAVTFNGGSSATYMLGAASSGYALNLTAGTMNFQSGTLTLNGDGNSEHSRIIGNSTFNLSGGTVNSAYYMRLGSGAEGTLSTLNVSGGVFNNTGEILFGFGGAGGSGTLNISGGAVNSYYLRMGDSNPNGTHTVNLDGGTLTAARIFRNNATPVFNFNGGVLAAHAYPITPWFEASVSNVFVKNGGAIIDTAGKSVTIEPDIKPFSGSTGGLTKIGAGTLTLSGTGTYNGPTTVSNGTLSINGNLYSGGDVFVLSNATLSVNSQISGDSDVFVSGGATLTGTGVVAGAVTVLNGGKLNPGAGQLTTGDLTLNPDATLTLALDATGNPANVQVNGNLVLDGHAIVSDLGGMSSGAVYAVINYTGTLTDNGLDVDPYSSWSMTVDTSVPHVVRLVATQSYPVITIINGDSTVTSLSTNLTAIVHGAPTNVIWYEVRSNSLNGTLTDFGAHVPSCVWPFTVRHLKGGTNWVTVFARDNAGQIFSNSVRLVLNLPYNTPVRPRPIPAEIWWGGLSENQQLLDSSKPWDFVKKYEDGIFFHTAVDTATRGYPGLTGDEKTAFASMLRPYNTKYWIELFGFIDDATDAAAQSRATNNCAVLTEYQNLGLAMSQATHDYYMENLWELCLKHPDWSTNNLVAWWTGDLTGASTNYPYTSGLWRDMFTTYYSNNPHLKIGHTSSPVNWPWDANNPSLQTLNELYYWPLSSNGYSATSNPVQVNGSNVYFSFTADKIVNGFIAMAGTINHPYYSFQTDCPWDYYKGTNNAAKRAINRAKIRFYEKQIQARGARHTFICNISNTKNLTNDFPAEVTDLYYKTNSLDSLYTHQIEGGRANCYLFESWYWHIPANAAPETKVGSYANLAMDAIKYLKGIADTNGTLEPLKLTLLSGGTTNTIELRNNGDIACLPAVAAIETGTGGGAVTYYDAAGSNITALILSAEGYVPTNRLTPGTTTTIRVVSSAPLNRAVTLEAFWNPQDPTGVVRDRLTLSPPNQPPVLAAISNYTIIAGQTLVVTNAATDPDIPPQTLTFSLTGSPPEAVINTNSGVFSWRPAIAQSPSTNIVSVVVTDAGKPNLSATQSFWVTVNRPVQPTVGTSGTIGMSNGHFNITINGDGGPDYTILASTNLIDWSSVWMTNSLTPPFIFSDPAATNFSRRFYRVILGP